jgi:hypothetical protein
MQSTAHRSYVTEALSDFRLGSPFGNIPAGQEARHFGDGHWFAPAETMSEKM